ncbi:PF11259 family protein [Schaalia georgiae F0490]|uniref:PF11259 family protein n=1 Tax=Schaalia georgiae F0490 TaxID=1125717 RepID=J0MQ47_9ACTO|nr:DUF3060 domain-containing protein [Schaalia georgiae]EJF36374.1 PF11259 family protein [Schaalia georgiae F0490]
MSIRKSPLAALASISIVAAAGFALSACGNNNATPQDAASSAASAAADAARSGAEAAGNAASSAAEAAGNAAEAAGNALSGDGVYTVGESNTTVALPSGTKTVVVNASNVDITGGDVTEIKVNGSENDIHVNSAQRVSFSGSDNEVYYAQGAAPQITSDTGAENKVAQGR